MVYVAMESFNGEHIVRTLGRWDNMILEPSAA